MRFDLWRRCSAIVLLCASTIFGQTKIDLRTQTKSIDFSGASSTKPAQMGSALPTTCGQGQFFFLVNAPAGQNVYGCSATNTWSLEGSAVPQTSLVPGELNKAGTLLTTDGTNPLWQTVGGDVSGAPTAFRVSGLLGRGLSTTAPANGQLLEFNGTSGLWTPLAIGGDVSGSPAALTVGALLGRGLSTLTPSDGQFLEFNGASGLWGPLAIGGDVAGAPTALKVGGLLGRPLSTTTPSDGQLLEFNGTSNQWSPLALAGDASGKATAIVVGALLGRALSTTAPSDGQLLEFNGTTSQWTPLGLTGDVSGKATGMVVGGLLGRPLSTTAPVDGQILEYNGTTSQWSPLGFAGDISGKPSGIVVGALQGRAVSATAPLDGQLLKYTGSASQWQPVALGGDVTGTPSLLTVSGLQGRAVAASVPASGQFLSWNATSNNWTPSTLQVPPNYNGGFTAVTTTTITGTQHNLNTPNLIVSCYDNAAPANMIEPSHITIDPASYNVIVTFAQAQTGRCVVNGSGGVALSSGVTSSGQLSDFAVSAASTTVLNIGTGCTVASPCHVGFGRSISTFSAGATATLSAGSGAAYVYVTSNGVLNVGSSGLTLACSSGCQVQTGITAFPPNSVPLYTWSAASGLWVAGGGADQRAFLSTKAIVSGPGIVITDNGSTSTIATDTTVVPMYFTGTATLAFPSIANGACAAELTIAVVGAQPGDGVAEGWPALPAGLLGMMRVSVAGTVAVRVCNLSGSALTPASLVYRATVVGTPN